MSKLRHPIEQWAAQPFPRNFDLKNPEVLLEPAFWVRLFELHDLRLKDLEGGWGVPGPVLIGFRAALSAYITKNRKLQLDGWLSQQVDKLVEHMRKLGRLFVRHPGTMSQFLTECWDEISEARQQVSHMVWTSGKKAAFAFASHMRMSDEDHPAFLRKAVKSARSKRTEDSYSGTQGQRKWHEWKKQKGNHKR